MKVQVAAIQYEPKFIDKEHNLKQLLSLTEEAAVRGAKLIVLPEMCTTGYYFDNREQILPLAEEIPNGPSTVAFSALSKKYNCYIVVGIAEINGSNLYNSAFFVGPDAYIGRYRKVQPFPPDNTWAKNGDEAIKVYSTPIGNIAILICMDISFPETASVCKSLGADIICVPMNWYEALMPSGIWITRAYENGVFLIAADRCGKEKGGVFGGETSIIGPDGDFLAVKKEGNAIVMSEIEPSQCRELPLIPRQRKMYSFLQCNPYHWPGNLSFKLYRDNRLPEGDTFMAGVAQFTPGEKENNIKIIKDLLIEANGKNLRYLVLPEFALSGIPNSRQEAEEIALDENDESIGQLQKLVSENNIHLVCGLVLKQDKQLYNAAIYIPPQGPALFYKKSHLNKQDKLWATQGTEEPLIINATGARLGIIIGEELNIPELSRLAANHGADMIMVPSAMPKYRAAYKDSPEGENHWHLARIRANENNTYVLFSNCLKGSGIFGPYMFLKHRQEVIITDDSLACIRIDTREIISKNDDFKWEVNKVREKFMLATRQENWYDAVFEMNPT